MDVSVLAPQLPLLLAAVVADAVLGDPVYALHPVRCMGRTLTSTERMLRSAGYAGYLGGCALLVVLVLLWVVLPSVILSVLHAYVPRAGWLGHFFLVYSLIALRDLLVHGWRVERALRQDDIHGAHTALGQLVGRDTRSMDAAACRRAVIESLAENVVDGFASPLFWYAVLGLPGLLLFKVVSTMDSMVGYKTPRYFRFGWCGARSDDLLNWLPARCTWLALVLAAAVSPRASVIKALRVGWCQHALVPGPNAGWSEAAIAGALQRRLVGPIWRDGQVVTTLWLGDPADPAAGTAADFLHACRLLILVGAVWVGWAAVMVGLWP